MSKSLEEIKCHPWPPPLATVLQSNVSSGHVVPPRSSSIAPVLNEMLRVNNHLQHHQLIMIRISTIFMIIVLSESQSESKSVSASISNITIIMIIIIITICCCCSSLTQWWWHCLLHGDKYEEVCCTTKGKAKEVPLVAGNTESMQYVMVP